MASQSSSACDVFKAYLDGLKQTKMDLEQLKNEVTIAQAKYHQRLAEYEAKFQELHTQTEKIQQEQFEKEINLENASAEWRDVKSRLESNAISSHTKVKLNVGGTYFETVMETLTRNSEDQLTYFQAFFSGQWQSEKDPKDDSIFIDRSGDLFWHILQYLRTGKLIFDDNDMTLRQSLIIEAEFYKIESLVKLLKSLQTKAQTPSIEQKQCYLDSGILSSKNQEDLNRLYGVNRQQWRLIYRASRDGFTAQSFHKRCDEYGPTMTVIRSTTGHIFGGFTTVSWSSSGEDNSDARAFLFTLKNPHGIKPTKYPIKESSIMFAVSHRKANGPTFGSTFNGGSDIHLRDPFNAPGSRSFFPHTYADTTGRGSKIFTGDSHFSCEDVEVFLLVS